MENRNRAKGQSCQSKGDGMTATLNREPEVEIFDSQVNLVGLSASDFHAHFDPFALLLIRQSENEKERFVVAGFPVDDRGAFIDAASEKLGVPSLDGYSIGYGPKKLASAMETIGKQHTR